MKTWIKVLTTVIITAGIVGGGTYYFLNKKATVDKKNLQSQIDDLDKKIADANTALTAAQATTTTTATTATTDPTAGWKTYTNTRVNYSFGYPSSGLKLDLDETIKYPSTSSADSKTEDLVQYATSTTTYSVTTEVSGHATTVEAWITGSGSGPTADGFPSRNLSDYTKTTVGNVTAYTSKSKLATYVVVGTKYYSICAHYGNDLKTGIDSIYSHLLSSFTFTK